jgi:hypothetical protein
MGRQVTNVRAIELPPVDRLIPAVNTLDFCSTRVVQTGLSYWRTVGLVEEYGYRISALEEIGWLDGGNGRKALSDELFADLLRSSKALWEWTRICLRAPRGRRSFRSGEEVVRGERFHRADCYLDEERIAEGILLPEGNGRAVVEWDERLRLPRRTSETFGPAHAAHFHFDADECEVAVLLCKGRYAEETGSCLDLMAVFRRALNAGYCGCRLFGRRAENGETVSV